MRYLMLSDREGEWMHTLFLAHYEEFIGHEFDMMQNIKMKFNKSRKRYYNNNGR